MASSTPTQLPAYIALRYEENGVFDRLYGAAEDAAARTKRQFERSFKETETVISGAMKRISSEVGKIDLGLGDMRQQAAEIRVYKDMLTQVSIEAQRLASETGDTSAATRDYLRSIQAQRSEAERALQVAETQITTYSRLQSALDGSTAANQRLTSSQRELYAEQARAARIEVAGREHQSLYSAGFGYDRAPKSASDSADVFRLAADAEKLRAQLNPMVAATQQYNQELERAIQLRRAGAITETEYGQAVDRARGFVQAAIEAERERNRQQQQPTVDYTAQAQNLEFLAAIERAEADAKQAQGRAADEAAARNIDFVEALKKARVESELSQKAQAELTREVNELRLAMDPSLALQQRFDAEMERADRLMSQGAIGAREYGQAQDFARQQLSEGYQALFRSNEAHEGYIVTSRRFNQAVLQSGQQMQDFAIQVYSGQSASVAAAQQLPQLAFALSGLEGHTNKTYDRIGKFATYLSGPWGLAVGLGAGVLGTLVYQMVATGDATDDLVAKLQEEARETERTTRAQEQFGETAEGVKKAIEEQRAALDKQIASLKTEAERNVESAKTNLAREIQIRNTTKALLESLIAQEQYNAAYARSPNAAKDGNLGQGMLELSQRRVQAAEWKLAEQNASIEIAKYNLTVADSFLTVEQASQSAEEAINKRYDGMIERARKAAVASGTVATALGKEVAGYEAARKAELEAIKATSGASASAQANLGDMVALIKDLFPGATITSTTGGKHVKGSDHYAGRALDFVPGGGMGQYTTAEVEQILRDAGVDIRRNAGGVQQLFGPGRSAGKKGDHDDHFHLAWQGSVPDPEKVKAATAKAQELLARFGDQSAEAIARINERFDEQPRLIDQAAQATRQLDAVIADLSQRKPPGFEQMIADAEAAKGTIEDALVRPFRQMADDAQRRLQIQTALAAGQEDEAAALQEIFRLEDQIGDLTNDQKDAVRAVVAEEQRRTRELERQRALFEAQLDVLDQARSSLTDLLSGRSSNFFGDIRQALQDLNGKRMFDSLFGDMFQQIEDELRGQSPLGKESQRAADELTKFTDAVKGATAGISGAANDNGLVTASATSPEFKQAFDALFSGRTVGWSGGMNAPGAMSAAGESGVIEVTTKRPTDITNRSITEIADKISGAIVNPFEKALSDAFGTEFAQMLGGVMKGALSGYMTGGTTGGILGGLKGIVDQTGIFGGSTGGVSGALGKAGSGAATGTMAAGIMKSLGLKTSTTGAQIGGAIGSFVPIPGGEIIGSIAGGLIGGLFKTNRTANAVLTNGSGYTQSGKDSGNYSTAAGLGDSVLEGLNNIVDQLGGEIGNFMVTIGTRGDEYRVNTNGTSLKLKNGAISFGDDAEAAIAYAIKNAIEDGAIKGMRQSTINIIKAGKDLDAALSDAVDWENAFKELAKYKDPIGSALDDLDEEFEKLIAIGKAGSASAEEMAQLEELYGIKRNEIIKEQAESLVGSLKSLLSDLTTGDNGLSLRDRRNAALSEYDALAARVQAGDTTAYDDYTDAAQTLLGIERDLYGSQQEYFDRLNEVIDLTKTRIDAETNVVSINENRDSPFDSTGAVKSSIDTVNDTLTSQLTAVNQNIGTLINLWGQVVTTGSSSTSASRLTFASSF
jgi:hypothetical protein